MLHSPPDPARAGPEAHRGGVPSPRVTLVLAVARFALPVSGLAQQHGEPVELRSTVNVVGQAAGQDATRSELVASMDLFADVNLGRLIVHAYVEANTTPRRSGVSRRIPAANMDAGTALGASGRGRVQLSELRIDWPITDRATWHAGLMDLTGYLDVSRISNDENLFFLGQPFVNNPTIIFPDYTLGTTLELGMPALPRGRIALSLSSSHGLGDNPNVSYGELFDLSQDGKGVFAAGRMRWEADRWVGALGGWASTGGRRETASTLRALPTRGVYSVVGCSSGTHSLNARVGVATGNDDTETFLGLTYLGTLRSTALGIGVARTPVLPSFVDRRTGHAELFLRRSIVNVLYLTTSIQWLSEAVLPEGDGEGTWILGFRISAAFD